MNFEFFVATNSSPDTRQLPYRWVLSVTEHVGKKTGRNGTTRGPEVGLGGPLGRILERTVDVQVQGLLGTRRHKL